MCCHYEVYECRLVGCNRLLVTADVPNSRIPSTLKMEVTRSSETSVLPRCTRRHIQADGILHNHRRVNLKSYTYWKFLALGSVTVGCCTSPISARDEDVRTIVLQLQVYRNVTMKPDNELEQISTSLLLRNIRST
jgi:hypothetical protein